MLFSAPKYGLFRHKQAWKHEGHLKVEVKFALQEALLFLAVTYG